MSHKYSFQLAQRDRGPELPRKVIVGREDPETTAHVLLKLLGFLLFFRERLQIEPRLHDEDIPFRPDLLQLDYALRPRLWVECGMCSVDKLDRLAVKAPDAEIWILKRSAGEAEALLREMARRDVRRGRYGVIGLEAVMFDELLERMTTRNSVFWMEGTFDPPRLQFDFNGLWFDSEFLLESF